MRWSRYSAIIPMRSDMYGKVFEAISRLSESGERVIAAIEGPAASGKTTLSAELEKHFDCNVFHMDDFFLRPFQRTSDRLAEPDGNIDAERFYDEVITGILSGDDFEYRPYCCSAQKLSDHVQVKCRRLNIVEGVYSMHRSLIGYYDLCIFLDIDGELQQRRLEMRESGEKLELYRRVWLPMEERYFRTFEPCKHSDIVINI